MKTILSLFLLLLAAGLASADIPANRLPPAGFWNPGCIGTNGQTYRQSGTFIPPVNLTNIINVKNPPYNAVGDGFHDDTTNIQFAIGNGNNSIIYLPPGTYKITGTLELANPNYPWSWSSKILRGAGSTNTFIKAYATSGPFIDATTTSYNESRNLAQTAPLGTNTITVTSWDSFYNTQNWGILYTPNSIVGTPWSYGQAYETEAQCQIVHIIARNPAALTLTFDTPTYFNWNTNTIFAVFYGSDSSAGVENLSIENVSGASTHNINFSGVFNSWVRGVESKNAYKWHVRLNDCARCDILDSFIHGYYPSSAVGGGDSDYGAGIYGQSSDNLVMNNIFDRCRHSLIVEYGDTGNVFAYNYVQNAINNDTGNQETTDYQMEASDQHGCTQWNLWEGNVVPKFAQDDSLGGSVNNMGFRNNLSRQSLPSVYLAKWGYDVQVSNYWVTVADCVIANCGYSPTWRVGAPNANGDIIGVQFPDPAGTPADPRPTLYVHGVLDLQSNLVQWVSTNANHTFPASLFLTNPPSFWGSTPWPAIGVDVAGYTNAIPAQLNITNVVFTIPVLYTNPPSGSSSGNAPSPPSQLQVTPLN
jgi:hypothetical protein